MEIDPPYKLELITELTGHDDRAWHVAWNPVRPLLASCSSDKSVRLYAFQPGTAATDDVQFKHVATIQTGHTKTVRAVAWAPSGRTLATASFDTNIGVWEQEPGDGEEREGQGEWECASLLEGHDTECKSVAYSSSGTLLASCSRDKTVWIWEVHPDLDFECLGVLMEHSEDVKAVSWHPTEEILASASYDNTIKLYIDDPSDDWFCFTTLTGHTSTVWALAWAPDGRFLASASDDLTVRVWKRVEEHKWECVLVLKGHERSVYSVSWGKAKGKEGSLGWIASAGGDGFVNVWEVDEPPNTPTSSLTPLKHTHLARYASAHGVSDVNSVVWCPREGYEDLLSTAGDDGAVRVWRVSPV